MHVNTYYMTNNVEVKKNNEFLEIFEFSNDLNQIDKKSEKGEKEKREVVRKSEKGISKIL